MLQVRQTRVNRKSKSSTYEPHNALRYIKKMAPHSENSLQHLAASILMFLNTSVQFLGSNSNDGVLKAENVLPDMVYRCVFPQRFYMD